MVGECIGIFFDLTSAAASCTMSDGYGAYVFRIIAPPIIAGFTSGKASEADPQHSPPGV